MFVPVGSPEWVSEARASTERAIQAGIWTSPAAVTVAAALVILLDLLDLIRVTIIRLRLGDHSFCKNC